MSGVSGGIVDLSLIVLGIGLALAAAWDVRFREVPDRLWQGMGIAGAALGFVVLDGSGAVGIVAWTLASFLALEHFFGWDTRWEGTDSPAGAILEAALYVGIGATLIGFAWSYGVGGGGVPIAALAVYATVVVVRGLFEAGVVYGGADAKALVAIAIVLPVWASPLWGGGGASAPWLAIVPFALTALVNAAVLTLVVPIALALRNVRVREFSFPRGFLGLSIPTAELSARYVWLKEPATSVPAADESIDTAEDDRRVRARQVAELRARGVERAWVTPQLPLVLFLALGAGAALAIGNLVLDFVAIL